MKPFTLTHQPQRVAQGTLSWTRTGGLCSSLQTSPPHSLCGCRVLEPREGENTVAAYFLPPLGALGAASLQGLGCSDSDPHLPASQPSELLLPPPAPIPRKTKIDTSKIALLRQWAVGMDHSLLGRGCCLVYCRILSSIPDLCPLVPVAPSSAPSYNHQKCSQMWPNVPWGTKSPTENPVPTGLP